METDRFGNIFIAGTTRSPDFPTTAGAYDEAVDISLGKTRWGHNSEIFVAKFSPAGKLVWSTVIGGPNSEEAYGLEIDSRGYVVVHGRGAIGSPVTRGVYQPQFKGCGGRDPGNPHNTAQNAYICKLSPDGASLVWASFFGIDHLHRDLALDKNDDIYATWGVRPDANDRSHWDTWIAPAWVKNAFQPRPQGGADCGVAKIAADGSRVLWATYLGGSDYDSIEASIDVDDQGYVYVGCQTKSRDIPTTPGAHDRTHNGGVDWYVAKLTPDGSDVVYGTFIGDEGDNWLNTHNLVVDSQGNCYSSTCAFHSSFPTTDGAVQRTHAGGKVDWGIVKLSPTGALLAGTLLGGRGSDNPDGIRIDSRGDLCLFGQTGSSDFPVSSDAFQRAKGTQDDAVMVKLSPNLDRIVYSTFLGGDGNNAGRAGCVDDAGNLIVAGSSSGGWPLKNAFQTERRGRGDSIVAKLARILRPRAKKVTIYRDVYGVPHIFADTEAAGAYALAIAQCQDNAKQVFENLRIGCGRSAELFGERTLDRDRQIRLSRIPEIAEDGWRNSDLRTRQFLQAYCDGLNHYRTQFPDECKNSLEATPRQVLAWAEYFILMPCLGIHKIDIENTLKGAAAPAYPTGQSSTFVIGASCTASGRPMLLIDPHWPAEGSVSWLEFHLSAGRFDVGGFAVPGMPFAGLGYTPGATWGMTAGGADSADVFELVVDRDNPDRYWFDGKWHDMTVRRIRLPYKDGDKLTEREFKLRETVHGPVVYDKDGRVFTAAVCGWKKSHVHEQFLAMNRARNKSELLDALRMDELYWLNCCYATADGDIGYIQLGSAPIRPERPGEFPALNGTRSSACWKGTVPVDELPQIHAPKTDWLQSCNTCAPDATAGMKMTRKDFPPGTLFAHMPAEGGIVWRGRRDRCFEVLPKLQNATLDDAEALALDTFCPAGPIWAPALVEACDGLSEGLSDPTRDLKLAVNAVREWDFRTTKDSTGQSVFQFWREEYQKIRPEAFGDIQAVAFPKTDAEKAGAVTALRKAVERMKKLYGKVTVPWGSILRLRKGGVDLPLDGGGGPWATHSECMRSIAAKPLNDDGQLVFVGGQVVTTVVELADPIHVRPIVPYGQSRKPGNRHYTDQMRLYSEGCLRPVWHDWGSLKNHIESSQTVSFVPADAAS